MTSPPAGRRRARDERAGGELRVLSAGFLAGAAPGGGQLPPPTTVEIAFAGRSNVGKSSLINALVGQKRLVRTSSTPGSTRQINLYEVRLGTGAIFHLADLPGYGFTRRSRAEQASWGEHIERYLRTRATLRAVVLLVDVRRGILPDDRELIGFVEAPEVASRRPVEVIVVATKVDKLPRSARRVAVEALSKAAGKKAVGFSAMTGEGRDELWRLLESAALGAAGGRGAPKTSETA